MLAARPAGAADAGGDPMSEDAEREAMIRALEEWRRRVVHPGACFEEYSRLRREILRGEWPKESGQPKGDADAN